MEIVARQEVDGGGGEPRYVRGGWRILATLLSWIRRLLQFRLRTLIFSTMLVGALLGWIAKERRQSRVERAFGENCAYATYLGPFDSVELGQYNLPQGWWRDLARLTLGPRLVGIHIDASDATVDLTPLGGFAKLQFLSVTDDRITDLRAIGQNVNLTHLDLLTSADDLSPLTDLVNLEYLAIHCPTEPNLTPLANLSKLTHLRIRCAGEIDLAPLAKLTKLTTLAVDAPNVENLSALATLVDLGGLSIICPSLSDLEPLSELTGVTLLHIESMAVQDLRPLADLPNLIRLNVRVTSAHDLSPLQGLKSLSEVEANRKYVSLEQAKSLETALPGCRVRLALPGLIPLSEQSQTDVE